MNLTRLIIRNTIAGLTLGIIFSGCANSQKIDTPKPTKPTATYTYTIDKTYKKAIVILINKTIL